MAHRAVSDVSFEDYVAGPMTAKRLLERHMHRVGANKPVMTDVQAKYQYTLLEYMLSLVDTALQDEHVDPAVSRRILERLIYGAMPHPHEAEERQRILSETTHLLAHDLDSIGYTRDNKCGYCGVSLGRQHPQTCLNPYR